jgi:uncharacterized protein involved in outer membrane biogenesis
MRRFVVRAILAVLALLALVSIAAWAFLAAPVFEPRRQQIVGSLLSRALHRPVAVEGDVQLRVSQTVRLIATDARIPDLASATADLGRADRLELDADLSNLLAGRLIFDALTIDGLRLFFVTDQDGTQNWPASSAAAQTDPAGETGRSEASADSAQPSTDAKPGPFDSAKVTLRRASLDIDDQVTGFEFDLGFDDFVFQRSDQGSIAEFAANGQLNGEPVVVSGRYPRHAPFETLLRIGDIDVELTGGPDPLANGGLVGHLTSEIRELVVLLETLKLEPTLKGRATLDAGFRVQGSTISVDRFEARMASQRGATYRASGSIGDLARLHDINASLQGSLFAEGQAPPGAATIQDIAFTGFDLELAGEIDDLNLKSLSVYTNAFDQQFDEIGQVAINKVHRTEDGKLRIDNIRMQAGPPDAPLLVAEGSVGDVLAFSEIDLQGGLTVSAGTLLRSLDPDRALALGHIEGTFAITDTERGIGLNRLSAEVVGTDLWTFSTENSVENLRDLDHISVDMALGIENPGRFLDALGATPVDGGALRFDLGITGTGRSYVNRVTLAAGATRADITVNVDLEDTGAVARGSLVSDRVALSDIRNATAFFTHFFTREQAVAASRVVQPLVLPDARVVQPLILEEAREVQPLVLPKQDLSGAIDQFLSIDRLVSHSDVDFGIDIKQIVGADAVSRVNSELIVREGKLAFGPLRLSHGGGYVTIEAAMDVLKSPGILTLRGSTGGWDLGRILASIGADIGAYGVLSGRFALSGSSSGLDRFLRTMAGSAEISMGRGRIDTSLLELAGLGVVPWLFSRDLRQGYSQVVCIDAPVRIDRGRITTNAFVLETRDVQLVATGTIDVLNDVVSLRAEPRPVGRPLARSAVPVDIYGTLSNPQVRLHLAGERAVRRDDAPAMPQDRQPCKPDIDQLR